MSPQPACTPLSDKLPLCKIDAITLGIIVFTVFFLLVCLERVVKLARKVSTRGTCQPIDESTLPGATWSPPSKRSGSLDEKSSPETPDVEYMPPLRRCLERSASESMEDYAKRSRMNLRWLLRRPFATLSHARISKPRAAITNSRRHHDLEQVLPELPAISPLVLDGLRLPCTPVRLSDTRTFASIRRYSTPPPIILTGP